MLFKGKILLFKGKLKTKMVSSAAWMKAVV